MRSMIKPGLVLFCIALAMAVGLGLLQDITKGPIAHREAEAKTEAMGRVLPTAEGGMFDDEIQLEGEKDNKDGVVAYSAYRVDGDVAGYVMTVRTTKGYGSVIELMVGVDSGGVLTGVCVLRHSETPGLGAKASSEDFLLQFKGKAGVLEVIRSGEPKDNQIDAITSATITSRAVTAGVNDALKFFKDEGLQAGGGK